MDWKNRREFPRVPFEHHGEGIIELRIKIDILDISAGGLAFKTEVPLEPDSICRLVLFDGNIFVEAHILSCSALARKRPRYRVSGKFTTASGQLLEEILEMGKQITRKSAHVEQHMHSLQDATAAELRLPAQFDGREQEVLQQLVENLLDDGVVNVVFDLGNMREARPALLSQLEALDEEIREEGGSLMLARCSSRILSALQVARLASAIPIFETVEQALGSLPAKSEEGDEPA